MSKTRLLGLISILLICTFFAFLINALVLNQSQDQILDNIGGVNLDDSINNDDEIGVVRLTENLENQKEKEVVIQENAIYKTATIKDITTNNSIGVSSAIFQNGENVLLTTAFDTLPLKQSNEYYNLWLFNSLNGRYLSLGIVGISSDNFETIYSNEFFTNKTELDRFDIIILSLDTDNDITDFPDKKIALGNFTLNTEN